MFVLSIGDQTPNGFSNTKEKYDDSRIFTAFFCMIGAILLALLSNEVSRALLWILYHIFACPCCNCSNNEKSILTSSHTIKSIQKDGVINLRDFLLMHFSNDEQFKQKLTIGCNLFDKYDQDAKIELTELEIAHESDHRNSISSKSNNSQIKSTNSSIPNTNNYSMQLTQTNSATVQFQKSNEL